jgi:Tfp pilus assembly protein PilF
MILVDLDAMLSLKRMSLREVHARLVNDDGILQARHDFNRAIRDDPRETRAYIGRATCSHITKHYKLAIEDATKAIELDPKEKAGYLVRAAAYRAQGNDAAARADESRAKRLSR